MPGIGGRGFLERFKRLKVRIPVVISTAYPYLEEDSSTLGCDAFVVKSGDMTSLIEKVQELTS